jgi:hypothetical protein
LVIGTHLRAAEPASPARVDIQTLSTRPNLVSGGDVLVKVSLPTGARAEQLKVMLNGRDVTAAFKPAGETNSVVGLVKDLRLGTNEIEAAVKGQAASRLMVINHPIDGPVLSGPHQSPFVCETQVFGLGPALDNDCSAKTKVEYFYRTRDNMFKPLDPSAPRPADLVKTTTTEGKSVDYVVRLETGTINRAVYQIAFLHQPGQPLPDPWTSTPGWNRRLTYVFGGGCAAGYHQGGSTGWPKPGLPATFGVVDSPFTGDRLLAGGFAVASTSLNVFMQNCNDQLSAESAMMVKEYFIEHFGVPVHTIGIGGSGGSMQQNLIANNFPGILDGILPEESFPDAWTFLVDKFDCAVLAHAFDTWGTAWSPQQRGAVASSADFRYCAVHGPGWSHLFTATRGQGAVGGCNAAIPASLVYDPVKNPKGARCTVQDNQINIFGRDPSTGFARRPLDNVGVQYGLTALNKGAITFDQFAELNDRIGGVDIDGNFVPARTVGDPSALSIAYLTGQINNGAALESVPIIDLRRYDDDHGEDVHPSVRTYTMQARLIATNGHANNFVIWRTTHGDNPSYSGGFAEAYKQLEPHYYDAVLLMDQWLTSIEHDRGPGSRAEKVVRDKPTAAVDGCFTKEGTRINDMAKCDAMHPRRPTPRMIAGAPISDDVLKCQLKPVNAADYGVQLNAEQLARLKKVFPDGVCDYSKSGVGQVVRWRP